MSYKTLKEIIDLTKNRINFVDPDEQVDGIILNAINHAYMFDLSKVEPSFNKAYVPVINGTAPLPDDLHSIEKISPSLLDSEYRKGNSIISDRSVTFEVLYIVAPEPLVNDNDEPQLTLKSRYLLSTYACYEYFTFKKKSEVAQYYLGAYEREKNKIYSSDNIEKNIQDVTGW